MGSCVSKKAARAGAMANKEAATLPPEKEVVALPPPVVVEEEVKEVLSETAVSVSRPRPPPEPEKEVVKRRLERKEKVEEEASESASVASAMAEKAKAKGGGEQEVEQKAIGGMEKGRARRRTPEQRRPKEASNGRARSPSPASVQRRQGGGEHLAPPPRPRREQPAVVSGIGCRSGRFSPSAARRAAESAVRRTNSAREADMTLPHSSRTPAAKRSLHGNGNGVAYGGGAAKRDPGERSGRRPDSPTSKRIPPASPAANGAISRQQSLNGGATRKTAKDNTTLEQTKPQCGGGGGRSPEESRDGSDESALDEGHEQDKQTAEGALGQINPSVAMECFIFL